MKEVILEFIEIYELPFQIKEIGACVEDNNIIDFFNNICIIKDKKSKKAEEKLIKK